MGKEILLVTNYFPPEKGAAPNRMESLAKGLGAAGYFVKVVCPLPNYPTGKIFKDYKKNTFSVLENASFGSISRLWVWPSNSPNKLLRLVSMVSFSFSLILFFLFTKTPKKIFIQYSPVFVGFTAVCLGRLFSKKIILNVSDLWPLAGLEMGILKKGWYYSLLLKMERFCYRNADLIVGQSEEILHHISTFEKDKPFFLYRNIPNFPIPEIKENKFSEAINMVYAGLLGVAQGLFGICEKITFPNHVKLHIYEARPEAEKIMSLKKENVFFYGELDRDTLHRNLQQFDVAFIPLVKRIYGSVPSKIFEYTRLGLPVLYFAGGEGGDIVERENLGWVVPVSDFKELQHFVDAFSKEKLKAFPQESVQEKSRIVFDFNKQFEGFIAAIEKI